MKTTTFKVTHEYGLHARPAAILAQACVGMPSRITLSYNGKTAGGNNVLQILALHAVKGAEITITAG